MKKSTTVGFSQQNIVIDKKADISMTDNQGKLKVWNRIVLIGLYLSTSTHFLFPFLVLFLFDLGFKTSTSLWILSAAMATAGIFMPISGKAIDRGYIKSILAVDCVMILWGLVSFLYSQYFSDWIIGFSFIAFTVGTGCVYSAARRITEGMGVLSDLKRSAAISFLFENAGMGTAALLTLLFFKEYSKELAVVDCFVTIIFAFVLIVASTEIDKRLRSKTVSIQNIYFILVKHLEVILPLVFIFISIFTIFGGVPSLYLQHAEDAKLATSIMRITNTAVIVAVSAWVAVWPLKMKIKNQLLLGAALIAVGFLLIGIDITSFGIIISTTFWSAGEAIIYPCLTAYILGLFPGDQPGLAVGIKDGVIRLGLIISPLFSIVLNQQGPLVFALLFSLFPLLAMLLISRLKITQ